MRAIVNSVEFLGNDFEIGWTMDNEQGLHAEHSDHTVSVPAVGGALSPGEEAFEFWIAAQQLAYGARLLGATAPYRQDLLTTTLSPLSNYLSTSSSDPSEYRLYLKTLPMMTLEALCNLDASNLGIWRHHHFEWARCRDLMIWDPDKKRSLIAGAKLIANRILTGNLKAAQLIRIAELEFDCNWRDIPGIDAILDRLINRLGKQYTATHARKTYLAEFRNALPDRDSEPAYWSLVENCLLQQSYSWPLVVFNGVEASGGPKSGFALPVEVAVNIGGNGKAIVRPPKKNILMYDDWQDSAEKALVVAKELWKQRNSSWDSAFHKDVDSASVVLDLNIIEEIVEPYTDGKLWLEDFSLDVYLALVIYSQFVGGRTQMETICATGELREAWPDRDGIGGDCKVCRPAYVDAKIGGAFRGGVASKFITASDLRTPHRSRQGHLIISEVTTAKKGPLFSEFAKEARLDAERHVYIRCPDVQLAFRPPPPDSESAAAANALYQQLRSNSDPVVELDSTISASTVAQALCLVNNEVEKDHEAYRKLGRFAFVRATYNETNERFWQVIWNLLRGSQRDFSKFCLSVEGGIPGQLLAKELNRFTPDAKAFGFTAPNLRRAPDVLVIIGSKYLSLPSHGMPNSPFERLQLAPIAAQLRSRLTPSSGLDMTQRVGATRVILVPEDYVPEEIDENTIDTDIREYVERLSIFRHGFSFEMAQRILKPCVSDDNSFESIIDKLKNGTHNSKPILEFAAKANEFHLNVRTSRRDKQALAESHSHASNSIIGILEKDNDVSHFEFEHALTPVWLHEAEWHLRKTRDSARGAAKNEAARQHERLSRLGEGFGWSRLRWATERSNEDGDDILKVLQDYLGGLDRKIVRGTPQIHPIELVWAARFVSEMARRIRNQKLARDKYNGLVKYRDELFAWATRSSEIFDFFPDGKASSEGAICRYVIATTRVCDLLSAEDRLDLAEPYFQITDNIVASIPGAEGSVLDWEWFELLGDRERGQNIPTTPNARTVAVRQSHALAVPLYFRGIINDQAGISIIDQPFTRRPPLQTIVKYLGAADLAGVSPDQKIVEYICNQPQRVIKKLLNDQYKIALKSFSHVRLRWETGKAFVSARINATAF